MPLLLGTADAEIYRSPPNVLSSKTWSKSKYSQVCLVIICQIIDGVDDHFCECLRHFQTVCLCTWHNSKEPADCKLIHETVQLTKEAKPEMSSGYISLMAELFYSDIAEAKLVIFTHVQHVS